MKINQNKDVEIEKAIKFLVKSFETSGNNPKPVVLHSIKVGLFLNSLNYSKEIIIAGLLHDLLEDTKVTYNNIADRFGEKVASLVKANTLDTSISDHEKQYKENFNRCLKAGKDALIIKAADLYDNSDYYHLAGSEKLEQHLINKIKFFINEHQIILKDENIFKELRTKINHL